MDLLKVKLYRVQANEYDWKRANPLARSFKKL
jgi:hypothetical protein